MDGNVVNRKPDREATARPGGSNASFVEHHIDAGWVGLHPESEIGGVGARGARGVVEKKQCDAAGKQQHDRGPGDALTAAQVRGKLSFVFEPIGLVTEGANAVVAAIRRRAIQLQTARALGDPSHAGMVMQKTSDNKTVSAIS